MFTVNELSDLKFVLERYRSTLTDDTEEYRNLVDVIRVVVRETHEKLKKMGVAIASEVLETEKPYTVYVADPLHPTDKDKFYKQGEYDSCAKAIGVCKEIVRQNNPYPSEGESPEECYEKFLMFGEYPIIYSDDPDCMFDSLAYAKHLCGFKLHSEPITES